MARYAEIDIALADEGGYVARWEEDAVVIMESLFCVGKWEASRVRRRGAGVGCGLGRTVRWGGSVIGRRLLDSVGGTECLPLIEGCTRGAR